MGIHRTRLHLGRVELAFSFGIILKKKVWVTSLEWPNGRLLLSQLYPAILELPTPGIVSISTPVRENSSHFRQRDQLARNNTQQQVQQTICKPERC